MRLTLVSLYYWPDQGAVPRLLTELAEDCAAAGADVRVLTSRGRYLRFDDRLLPRRENRAGVAIERLWSTRFGRRTLIGRFCDYLTFLASAFARLLTTPDHTIMLCVSSPPMLAVLVAAAARFRGRRFVYKVEDLFPELAVALGTIRSSILARMAARVSAFSLRRAAVVVAIDAKMAEHLRAAAPDARLEVIPNWADGSALMPDSDAGNRFRRENELEGRFVVLYSGNLGLAHRFTEVLEAARLLGSKRREALFLFIGGGPRLEETQLASAGLTNVRFLSSLDPKDVPASHAAADLMLVTLDPRAEGLVVPSKFYAALAAGKPILYVARGGDELAAEIQNAELGWVAPFDPGALAECLERAMADPAGNRERGERARRLLEERFERKIATGHWIRLLETVEATELGSSRSLQKRGSARKNWS